MTFSLCWKGVTTLLQANFCLPEQNIETFLFNHLTVKMLERRSSERQQTCEESSSTWFYVLFYNASIAIGYDEMIGKECSFVYFSIGLLEISTVSVP